MVIGAGACTNRWCGNLAACEMKTRWLWFDTSSGYGYLLESKMLFYRIWREMSSELEGGWFLRSVVLAYFFLMSFARM